MTNAPFARQSVHPNHALLCRCILYWETIAILPKNHSFDLFFAGYILISFGILVEGFVRYCPHYIGSGFYTVAIVFWVRMNS